MPQAGYMSERPKVAFYEADDAAFLRSPSSRRRAGVAFRERSEEWHSRPSI